MPRVIAVILLFSTLSALSGCGAAAQRTEDTAYVQILRIRISKVRAAVDETRHTIATSGGAPYLPELYVRLAELMSEEASYHYRVAAERQQGEQDGLHVPQVRLLKTQAIGIYRRVLDEHPETHLKPRILFNIAQEQRELGEFDDMRSTLADLVELGESRFLQQALLLLGDYHFDRSELDEARGYYRRVTRGDSKRLSALANYKLAWVAVNQADCGRALQNFERAIVLGREVADAQEAREELEEVEDDEVASGDGSEAGEENDGDGDDDGEDRPETASDAAGDREEITQEELEAIGGDYAIDVRRAAVTDLAYCYTQERPTAEAATYLRRMAHDRPTYVAGLERMARRLGVMDEGDGLTTVLLELLRLGPVNQDRLDDARALHSAIRSTRDYTGVGQSVASMLRVVLDYTARLEVPLDQKQTLEEEFEVYVRDLLTRAQTQMEDLPEARQQAFAESLADGYQAYLDGFPEVDEYTAMMLNGADVATVAGRYVQAAELSLRAADRLGETTSTRRDALYDAVVRFQTVLREFDEGDVAGRDLARSGLRRAAMELLRFPLEAEQDRQVKFGIALSYFDNGDYLEALDHLNAVAYEYPRSEEANAAVRLILDGYNMLNDYQALAAAARRFMAEDSPVDDALRQEVQPVLAAAEQRILDELSLAAAGDEGGDLSVLTNFAEQNEGTELGERALVNAFVAARAMGDMEQLYELGDQMAESYPNSEQLPGMLATLGQSAVARFEVDRAVEFLRQAAAADHPQKSQLLGVVAQLEEQLGDLDGAQETYLEAIRGEDNPAARAEPLLRLAQLLERRGDPQETIRLLEPYVADGDPEVLVRVGLAKLGLGRFDEAEMDLQSALSAGSAASQGVRARANYGTAEVLRRAMEDYPAITDVMLLEEYVIVVDVVQQSYLDAVRQGDPDFSSMALLRLMSMARGAAERVGEFSPPPEVGEAREQIQAALMQRAATLEQTADEALEACKRQVWQTRQFGPSARACLAEDAPSGRIPSFDTPTPPRGENPEVPPELRERIARNPEDVDVLRELGIELLDRGAPHLAVVVLTAAAEQGAGPLEANLLGIAHAETGDEGRALRAFAFAAAGSVEAGRQNLAALLRRLDLRGAASTALETFSEGRPGGRTLSGGGGR